VTEHPFNAAVCRSGACTGTTGRLLPLLRAATRRCPHGVLISTGCLLHAPRCHAPGHDSGAYLLVQPCDEDRRPRGATIGVGPVLTDADADAAAEWLAYGNLDEALLAPRLRFGRKLDR
jgi:2-keto-3-deoxy-6-phosphogluconate aldolase